MLTEVYGVPNAQVHGRPGQAQHGVDVYGRSSRHGTIAIQCKRLSGSDAHGNPIPGGRITRKFLFAEGNSSLSFPQPIKLWILATTVRRDTRQQQHADDLTAEWRQNGVDRTAVIWSWDDCVGHLNSFPNLRQRYYADVIQVTGARDLDMMILETISMAFGRPAFEVPLRAEMSSDFMKALQDTQRVLRTGELLDRESRHVIRKAVGGYHQVQTAEWRLALGEIDKRLRRLRAQLLLGMKDGAIQDVGHYFLFRDHRLVDDLEALRASCVSLLREVLSDAGLPPV